MAALVALLRWGGIIDAPPPSARPSSDGYSVFIMKAHKVGCRNRGTLNWLINISDARDYVAFEAILNTGECFIWRKGTRVRVEETTFMERCFAEYGTTKRCYWSQSTAAEELKR